MDGRTGKDGKPVKCDKNRQEHRRQSRGLGVREGGRNMRMVVSEGDTKEA